MPSNSAQFLDFQTLPNEGVLLVPGRLDYAELLALAGELQNRPVTWLVEESSLVEPETRDYLARPDVIAATFSHDDRSPAEVGEALSSKLANGGLLVFIPSDVSTRNGSPCHIPHKTLRFLCHLGLPLTPLAVHIPHETKLATEDAGKLPLAIFRPGQMITGEKISIARFRESLMEASEAAFSSREFLRGSLGEALVAGLKKWGSKSELIDGSDDSSLSYHKLLAAAIALSHEVKNSTHRRRVGIILPPGKAGMVANLAVIFAGKIPVNLNFTASSGAIESAIDQADIDRFITAEPFVRKVPNFPWPPKRDLMHIERVLPAIKKKIIRWAILAKLLPASTISKMLGLHEAGRNNDEAILLFTSGSSGEPKGVPLTHRNLLANVCQFGSRLALGSDAAILGSLPLFHSFGCTVTLWYPIIEGIGLVTYPTPMETPRLAELIDEYEISLLLSTPTFLRGYMRRIDPNQLSSLRLVVTGAEKLPQSLADSFEKKFGIRPYEGYGLTETSPATNVNLSELAPDKDETPVMPFSRPGSVGQFLPGHAVRITDATNDEQTTLDQSGIIWLKGANIFPGYLDRPDLSKQVLVDGWFKTGDVGRVDDDGFLYIEGRMSRFSKIAGEMVPHENVEAAATKALGLDKETERKIAIVGIPDEKKGEALALLSCVTSGMLEQETVNLRYKLMDVGIPSLWCPKKIIPVKEIPVLASGKLDIKACQRLASGAK